jgi:ketosteroid isomerase-like protein
MSSVEQRLQALEDKRALQERITAYLVAVDDLSSVDAVLASFTEDAVFDMTGIDYGRFEGEKELRQFFEGVFAGMSHHAHYATNFHIDGLQGDRASCRTHVIGMGRSKEGDDVLFYLQYHLEYRRTGDGWKITRFSGKPLLPLS